MVIYQRSRSLPSYALNEYSIFLSPPLSLSRNDVRMCPANIRRITEFSALLDMARHSTARVCTCASTGGTGYSRGLVHQSTVTARHPKSSSLSNSIFSHPETFAASCNILRKLVSSGFNSVRSAARKVFQPLGMQQILKIRKALIEYQIECHTTHMTLHFSTVNLRP